MNDLKVGDWVKVIKPPASSFHTPLWSDRPQAYYLDEQTWDLVAGQTYQIQKFHTHYGPNYYPGSVGAPSTEYIVCTLSRLMPSNIFIDGDMEPLAIGLEFPPEQLCRVTKPTLQQSFGEWLGAARKNYPKQGERLLESLEERKPWERSSDWWKG